jgi:hypothetical protein
VPTGVVEFLVIAHGSAWEMLHAPIILVNGDFGMRERETNCRLLCLLGYQGQRLELNSAPLGLSGGGGPVG